MQLNVRNHLKIVFIYFIVSYSSAVILGAIQQTVNKFTNKNIRCHLEFFSQTLDCRKRGQRHDRRNVGIAGSLSPTWLSGKPQTMAVSPRVRCWALASNSFAVYL